MGEEVVSAIRDRIFPRIARDATPTVIWHAGEPTTVPIPWYRNAYTELRKTAPEATNFSLQSNGIGLGREWIQFARQTGTRIDRRLLQRTGKSSSFARRWREVGRDHQRCAI